jgi:hypothetical protein
MCPPPPGARPPPRATTLVDLERQLRLMEAAFARMFGEAIVYERTPPPSGWAWRSP